MTPPVLGLRHREVLLFGDGAHDWIDAKQFRFNPGGASSDVLLGALLADPAYRDHYAAPADFDQGEQELHGPYRLNAIAPRAFQPCAVDAAVEGMRAFARRYSSEEEAKTRLRRLGERVEPLLYDATRHDWGWVIDDFTEFVVINDVTQDLMLVVAGED